MKQLNVSLLFICVVFIQGCSTTINNEQAAKTDAYLDEQFKSSYEIETEEQIFHLTPEMKNYVYQRLEPTEKTSNKAKTLIQDLFSPDYMDIHYSPSATYTPSETFEKGLANCMSLTLLAYVLVDEAGLNAKFMNVEVEENWNVTQQFTQLNGHVNLEIASKVSLNRILYNSVKHYTIDFLPMLNTKVNTKYELSKSEIIALFYNNKGALALSSGDKEIAYQYFKQATLLAPNMASVWGNLASLYRQSGYLTEAEDLFNHAISIAPHNLTVKENLALLYRLTDRDEEAEKLTRIVKQARKDNPFYYSMLAEEALLNNELQSAKKLYKKALKLNNKEHTFYFGLAKTHLQLNELTKAERYLEKAKRLSKDDQQKEKYQSKISALANLVAKVH